MTWIRRAIGTVILCLLAAAPVPAQSGLLGHYFDEVMPAPLGTSPSHERVDQGVGFTWSGDAPGGTGIHPDDSYSTRWTGHVRVPSAGTWRFGTLSNDGVRLWVDGELVIDHWDQHTNEVDIATVDFDGPDWVSLRLEHFNNGGIGTIYLYYSGPGQPWAPIPPEALCAEGDCLPGYTLDAGPDILFLPPETSFQLQGRFAGLNTIPYPLANGLQAGWGQIAGAPALIDSPDSMITQVTPTGPGLLRFLLKVSDDSGGFATDEVLVYAMGESPVGALEGNLAKWQTLTLTFQHDTIVYQGGTPNPFLEFRLQVYFLHGASRAVHCVPGYFATDGNAAETAAEAGDKWRVHFTPDRAGRWYYFASFVNGPNVALDLSEVAGTPVSFDGATGSFDVEPAQTGASGFHAKGRLQYLGESYLRFAETGERFLESGANSPENFLGYFEFDATTDQGGIGNGLANGGSFDGLHHYDPHLADRIDRGVPTWHGSKGARIQGAIDYLASQGVNSLYALTYNIDGGDGREVWPWLTPTVKHHFDVSKLDQWGRVFEHMTRAGVALHVQTQETENEFWLSNGELGIERMLYYRELVARFGHMLALFWDLGEENDNTPEQRKLFADYIRAVDPWDHPITVHPHIGGITQTFDPMLGTHLEMAAIQGFPQTAVNETKQLVQSSIAAGRPWAVMHVEQAPGDQGVIPDALDFWHDVMRDQVLWGNLMSGGSGVEWYFGYANANDDLDCEDFRSRANLWQITRNAVGFFRTHLPIHLMQNADVLSTAFGSRVLAQRGQTYAVYLPNGGPTSLNLETNVGTFLVRWFDPRNGGALLQGSVSQISGPGFRSLGTPPAGGGDWVALVRRQANQPPAVDELRVEPDPFPGNTRFAVRLRASDPNGLTDLTEATIALVDPLGQTLLTVPLRDRGFGFYTLDANVGDLVPGTWRVNATLHDTANATATATTTFTAD